MPYKPVGADENGNFPPRVQTALNATIAGTISEDRSATTTGKSLLDTVNTTKPTVVWTGHSLAYGQDTSGTGTLPATNGASQTRSSTPPPEQMNTMLSFIMGASSGATVINQGYPGDQTATAITRWVGGVSGDIELFWLDTNDAINAGGFPGGPLTVAASVDNLTKLIRRANNRGSQSVVVAGAPNQNITNHRKIRAYTEAHRAVAQRLGVPFVDVAQVLLPLDSNTVWTDSTHLSPAAYSLVATRIAALFGPLGAAPRKVAAGDVIRPMHMQHIGGVITTRGGAAHGKTIQLTAGQTAMFPVEATGACVPLIRLYSEKVGSVGVGTGDSVYNLGATPIQRRYFNIPAGTGNASVIRSHTIHRGPDTISVRCLTGVIEIESIEFIAPPKPLRISGATKQVNVSALSGVTVGTSQAPTGGATWDAAADEGTPISPYTWGAGSGADAKVDFDAAVSAPSLSTRYSGVGIGAAYSPSNEHLVKSGYLALREGVTGDLIVREFDNDTVTDVRVTGVFPTSGEWRGRITFALKAAGEIEVYVGGTLRSTIAAPKWKHYTPLAVARVGDPTTVLACAVRGDAYA